MSSKDVIQPPSPEFSDPLGASIGLLVVTEAGLISEDFKGWLIGKQTNQPDRIINAQYEAASSFSTMAMSIVECPYYSNEAKAEQLRFLYEELISERRKAIEAKFPFMVNDQIEKRRIAFPSFNKIIDKRLDESLLQSPARIKQLRARFAIKGIGRVLGDKYLMELNHDLGSVVDEHKRILPRKGKKWQNIRKQRQTTEMAFAGAATLTGIAVAGYAIQRSRGRLARET